MEHANIIVSSIDEAKKFLKLAFPEFEHRGEGKSPGKRWEHFGTAETYVALEEMDESTSTDRKPHHDPGINHIGFVVEDVEGMAEKLAGAGFRSGDVHIEGEGPYRKRVYIFDGVGNEWEFVEYLTDDSSKANVYE
jgi:extradiol dioxygenase family protein